MKYPRLLSSGANNRVIVKGLRLIDVGISALRTQVGDKLFDKYIQTELQELAEFRQYFMNR